MKLVTIAADTGGHTGVLIESEVLDFSKAAPFLPAAALVPASMRRLLAGGPEGLDLIRRIVDWLRAAPAECEALRRAGVLRPAAATRLLAPVPRPNMVLSHGRAYASHRKEMRPGQAVPSGETPSAFIKNTGSITGPGAPIVVPPQCPDMLDFEGEFSIVFGAPCYNVAEDEALDYVAGYTIINDVSARDWVEIGRRSEWQGDRDLNRMGKQLPTFTPMGPVIATKDEIPDPHDVTLTTTLNGTVMQNAHTSDLIWRIPFLIAYFSRWYPFAPGDVLTTGSPAGTGFGRKPPVFMKPGDLVEVTVAGVGTLSNPVVAAS